MDAPIEHLEPMGKFRTPNAEKYVVQTPQRRDRIEVADPNPRNKVHRHAIVTPEGEWWASREGAFPCE